MEVKVKAFWSEQAQGFIRVEEIDGVLPKIYLINTKIAKRYSGFKLIYKDLFSVKEVIHELKLLKNNGGFSIIKQSLAFNAIITYGKCFAEASGRGTQLNKKDALKYASKEDAEEHETIIDQRNNYIAHGGSKGYEHNPIVAILNPDDSKKEIIKVQDNMMGLVDIDSQLERFESLIESVIKYVKEQSKELYIKVEEEIKSIPIDSLYSEAIDIPIGELIEINGNQN